MATKPDRSGEQCLLRDYATRQIKKACPRVAGTPSYAVVERTYWFSSKSTITPVAIATSRKSPLSLRTQ
jgi:hypothetical protein